MIALDIDNFRVMDSSSTTVIDIGGTMIKVFKYTGLSEDKKLVCSNRMQTPSTAEGLLEKLRQIKGESRCSEYIIGLPGPVTYLSKEVRCPPLGYTVELKKINEVLSDSSILVMNDMIPFLISASCEYKDLELSVFTIGTSLGHACLRSIEANKKVLLSVESAHQEVGDRLRRWLSSNNISSSEPSSKMNYMNYRFMSRAIVAASSETPNGELDILEAIADEIASCERLMPGSQVILLEGGFGTWLLERPDTKEALARIVRQKIPNKPRVLVGSLKFEHFKNNAYIRENFLSPGMLRT